MKVGGLVLVINYKVYPSAFSEKGLEIAKEASRIQGEFEGALRIILAVPAPIIYKVHSVFSNIYIQHVDAIDLGAATGFIPAESVRYLPLKGVLLNHSEHKVTCRDLVKVVGTIKQMGKETLVCADTPEEAACIAQLHPTYVAVEPPELIGTGVPVSKAKPEVIMKTVDRVRQIASDILVLAGAGIASPEDAAKSIELGARGILISSYIMKAPDPGRRIKLLADAMVRALK